MTAYRTHVRLASAAVAASAVLATSLAALVLPGLAQADESEPGKRAAIASSTPTSTTSERPTPTTSSTPRPTSPASRPTAGHSETAQVKTTNAPGSSASFAPEQDWEVLDPRFNKNQLNLLAGESFVLYADVLHSQPLEQNLSITLSKLTNVKCKAQDDTVSAGSSSPLETFVVDCMVTKGQTRISGLYQLRQADGSIIGEGLFGAAPQPQQSGATSSAKAQPGGVSTKKAAAPARTTNSSKPGESDPAAIAAEPSISIAEGRFTPAGFPVRAGQTFVFEKDVTVSDAPLNSTLIMTIDRQQNLDCRPRTAEVPQGSEGTTTLTFECTITGVDRAPGGWYTVKLADGTTMIDDAYFGLDPNRGGIADGAPTRPERDTSGGLADTGVSAAVMVALAGAGVATLTGIHLMRRRNN